MATIRDDLIINDDDYTEYKSKLDSLSTSIETQFESYINELQTICDEGITSGNVHDNLLSFVSKLLELKGQFKTISNEFGADAESFDETADSLDYGLYNE